MKKLIRLGYFCAIASICLASVSAQGNFTIDNFDLRNGVRVELPPLPPPAPLPQTATAAPKKRAKATPPPQTQLTASFLPTIPAETKYAHPYGMKMAQGNSMDGYTTGDALIDSYIVAAARRNGLDPLLVYSLMHQESAFKKTATSYKGARGLMQLMPGTAARFGVTNIYDPQMNIEGGTKYLRLLLDMFDGDVALALAGYNAGEGAVLKYGRRVPPYSETQEYVRRITNRYSLLRNPQTARVARPVTPKQVVTVVEKPSAPLTIYERTVFAVRLPDGKMRLVNQ
jgi:soluble lytic murein transglycosylase-like protein